MVSDLLWVVHFRRYDPLRMPFNKSANQISEKLTSNCNQIWRNILLADLVYRQIRQTLNPPIYNSYRVYAVPLSSFSLLVLHFLF